MGKPTGFMEYDRENAAAVAPKERIKNFNEFHTPLSKEKPGWYEYHGNDQRMSAA